MALPPAWEPGRWAIPATLALLYTLSQKHLVTTITISIRALHTMAGLMAVATMAAVVIAVGAVDIIKL